VLIRYLDRGSAHVVPRKHVSFALSAANLLEPGTKALENILRGDRSSQSINIMGRAFQMTSIITAPKPEDDLTEDELLSDYPPERVFFSVLVRYDLENPLVRKKVDADRALLKSEPIATFPQASRFSEEAARNITKSYRGATIRVFDLDHVPDQYNIYIHDKKSRPIAKLGVVCEDYRGKTIH
jgi:hypothetical protein